MKKILTLGVVLAAGLLTLTGCGKKEANSLNGLETCGLPVNSKTNKRVDFSAIQVFGLICTRRTTMQ